MSLTLHTTHGPIKLQLYCEQTPNTCKNFLALCAKGYFDKTIFHRNISRFLIQGGDPTGTGKGGSSIYGGPFKDEIVQSLKHDKRGVVSMANSGANTNESQFFITYSKQHQLNKAYTIFGRVIDGFDSLQLMEREAVDNNYVPLNQIKIHYVTIHANPIAQNQQM